MKNSRLSGAIALAMAGFLAGPALAQGASSGAEQISGNPATGQRNAVVCRACHQIGPNAKDSIGPVLNGVVGRKAATYPGYSYSSALKSSGITWTVPELQKWLAGPQKLVPGTKMAFPGVSDPKKVNDIIAYLAQYDEKGEKK